jgi:midasin
MVHDMSIADLETGTTEIPLTTWIESDDLIQSMLVVTQGIKSDSSNQKEDEAVHVPSHFASLNSTATSLRVTGVLDKLDSFIGSLASHSTAISPLVLFRVLPFVQDIAESFSHLVYARSYSLKSTYKLAYVVSRLVLDLAQKGFCKPQEESDSKDDDAGGETVDGTGMGSGTGDKNVSSEIEEEGQVEGLQGEKEEDGPEEDKENEDDAVSMDEDFEGQLGDAKEGEDDGEGSEGDEEERDDHVGDVDPLDPGAVDEKFWGDEEKEEQKDDGKEDLMNQKDEGGESEMAAKESEGEKKDDKKKDEQKDGEGEQNEGEQNEAEEGQQDLDDFDKDDTMDDDRDEGDERDGEEGGVQDQDDVVMPEGDRLDLPEDMDLGGDDDDDDAGQGEEIDDLSMKGDDEGEEVEPSDAGQASDDDGAQEDDAPAPTGATEEEANEPDDTLNPNVDTSAANDNQAQQSAEAGAGLDGGDDQQGQEKDDAEMAENEEPTEGDG